MKFSQLFTLVASFVCVLNKVVRKFTSVVDASPFFDANSCLVAYINSCILAITKLCCPLLINIFYISFSLSIKRGHR